ncbi:phosphate signaling complex protein PhoU [Pontibacter sp. 172403-2]|uniref:phosphate signaling complex protein PhoU n=1 Tax=Pontibacter rufus TaxID=2791028 RepID=UPI0018AFA90B|nr:phosphate signaling complex protein PhoU [Pontibacter sp. 172403-2]MBF9251770.1 phosphate signaling complex protein PhoU [Pontibacter sp. 172403-2]
MPHIDVEMKALQDKLLEMWDLVEYQLAGGREALLNQDVVLAEKIMKLGRKVNRYDIKIDRQCENFIALFNPLAVDLRQVLASLKINNNLERIGDTAEGISRIVTKLKEPIPQELLDATRTSEMYEKALFMFSSTRKVFLSSNTAEARLILKQDKLLNKIYRQSDKVLAKYLREHPEQIEVGLHLYNLIKKLERVGDQTTNIAEEIIFYRDAKVVRHRVKKKKKGS